MNTFKNIVSTGISLQKKTGTQEAELCIDDSFSGSFLTVPENVGSLLVAQRAGTGKIESITCPRSMTHCLVQSFCLRNLIAPKICANFALAVSPYTAFMYTKELFPKVLKPMGSVSRTSFRVSGISNISHDFSRYSHLLNIEADHCSFTSDTDTIVLPVAYGITSYTKIALAPRIKTIRLSKCKAVSSAAKVVLDFDNVPGDITVVVDCNINYLEINFFKYNACLSIAGKGTVSGGIINCYIQSRVDIADRWRFDFRLNPVY